MEAQEYETAVATFTKAQALDPSSAAIEAAHINAAVFCE